MNEPTSIRVTRLLERAKQDGMGLKEATVYIAYLIADKQDRVHMDKKDLVGLIVNINRNFEDK